MRRIYESAGGIDVPEIAEKADGRQGAGARAARLARLPYHGTGRLVRAVVRHSGMFAVTSKMYPLSFLKEMYDLDEAAKRRVRYMGRRTFAAAR